MNIKVLCSCDHKGQDKLHGEKIRVYNECIGKNLIWVDDECISKTSSKKGYLPNNFKVKRRL